MRTHRGCGRPVTLHSREPLRYRCPAHGLIEWDRATFGTNADRAAQPAPARVEPPAVTPALVAEQPTPRDELTLF